MCSIFGAVTSPFLPMMAHRDEAELNESLNDLIRRSHERGRDGRGFVIIREAQETEDLHDCSRVESARCGPYDFNAWDQATTIIGNTRAEPTTEYVAEKSPDDQQPYSLGGWHIVHNGTIANDSDLRTHELHTKIDSAAIVESLSREEASGATLWEAFAQTIRSLKGSFAILAAHESQPGVILAACNYRPIWYAACGDYTLFASSKDYLPSDMAREMLKPYSMAVFVGGNVYPAHTEDLLKTEARRSLVVCSGGLDSVVAATAAVGRGDYVELVHFQYGSRAEGPEVLAVQAAAEELGVKCTLFPIPIYDPADSPLLRADSSIAGGEAGAEFAYEWVPARNLVMLSVATAYAEAKGFNNIILGNNLEEAGAYPDNEPEFINRMNEVMPFAVGDGKRVRIEMPVGNLMKHEIVKLGHELKAPLDKTWSCYRAGAKHCGKCGPCYMRRTAFAINGLDEVIQYEGE